MNEKAKKMYIDFGCSKFQMDREGVLEEYEKYNISKFQENIWAEEVLTQHINFMRNIGIGLATLGKTFKLIRQTRSFANINTIYNILRDRRNDYTNVEFNKFVNKFIEEVKTTEKKGFDGAKIIKFAEELIK